MERNAFFSKTTARTIARISDQDYSRGALTESMRARPVNRDNLEEDIKNHHADRVFDPIVVHDQQDGEEDSGKVLGTNKVRFSDLHGIFN